MYPPPVGEKSITPMPGFLQDGDGGDVLTVCALLIPCF